MKGSQLGAVSTSKEVEDDSSFVGYGLNFHLSQNVLTVVPFSEEEEQEVVFSDHGVSGSQESDHDHSEDESEEDESSDGDDEVD